MKKFISIICFFVVAFGLQAKENKVATVQLEINPAMHCANCENRIKEQLKFEKGISDIIATAPGNTITVKYNPEKTDVAKIEASLAKAGYEAHEVCATPCHQSEAKGSCCESKGHESGCGAKAQGASCESKHACGGAHSCHK